MDAQILHRAADEWGTPLYVYDGNLIREKCRRFQKAVSQQYEKVKICYAAKANTNLSILTLLREEGSSIDAVSVGEIDAALKVGYNPENIIYTSNSKTDPDLRYAIQKGVIINLDNLIELEALLKIAALEGVVPRISFRVNPEIDAKTHPKISTALRSSKFGLPVHGCFALEAYRLALKSENVNVAGVHAHIGSQITDVSAFVELGMKMADFVEQLKVELDLELEFIDIGGGLGIPYKGESMIGPKDYASSVIPPLKETFRRLGIKPELWFEPGRYLVGDAGVLATRVNSVKEANGRAFINVDSGFNTLIRPAMYDAYHGISVVGKEGDKPTKTYTIAGNLCESGDVFAKDRKLPEVKKGDLIAIHDVGAYGYSMASNYNSMTLPAEVLVLDGESHLIRERQKIEDLYRRQTIPEELKG
ncbi:MAG: diaminopimelate decarboxylase [Candidatus Altiarchaeota archaeon]